MSSLPLRMSVQGREGVWFARMPLYALQITQRLVLGYYYMDFFKESCSHKCQKYTTVVVVNSVQICPYSMKGLNLHISFSYAHYNITHLLMLVETYSSRTALTHIHIGQNKHFKNTMPVLLFEGKAHIWAYVCEGTCTINICLSKKYVRCALCI